MLARSYHLTVAQFRKNPNLTARFSSILFGLSIKITKSKSKSKTKTSRFVIVVPKRLDKRSTNRNKSKRIISEALNKIIPKISLSRDVWLQAKKILHKNQKTEVEIELLKLFSRAQLL